MNKKNNWVQIIIGLVLLGIIGYGLYWVTRTVFINIVSLQKEVVIVVVASGLTAVVSLSTYFFGRYFEKQREIANQFREKKIAIYEEFINSWFDQIMPIDDRKSTTNGELSPEFRAFLKQFARKMILWCSDDFITQYASFKKAASTMGANPKTGFLEFEKLLLSIRKDLNNRNKKIKQGDLLRTFINDYDTYFAQK